MTEFITAKENVILQENWSSRAFVGICKKLVTLIYTIRKQVTTKKRWEKIDILRCVPSLYLYLPAIHGSIYVPQCP